MSFTVEKRVQKVEKNKAVMALEMVKENATAASLKKLIAEFKKENVLSFVVTNTKTGVQQLYKKTKQDANYTVKSLVK